MAIRKTEWVVIGDTFIKHRAKYAKCRCVCGTVREVCLSSIRRGVSKSCGCQREKRKAKHNYKSRTYRAWNQMMQRCYNTKNTNYHHYGARGITVCDEWSVFDGFLRDMGECPTGLSIERIDNNLGYSKDNCRWATHKEQTRNRRTTRLFTYKNESKTVPEWSEITGINASTLCSRLYLYGWSVEKALTTPLRGKR